MYYVKGVTHSDEASEGYYHQQLLLPFLYLSAHCFDFTTHNFTVSVQPCFHQQQPDVSSCYKPTVDYLPSTEQQTDGR